MGNPRDSERFTYWKRPWQKWLVLTAAVVQLICFWINLSEYRSILAVRDGIFSAAEWERWRAGSVFLCAGNAITAAIFMGIFWIGVWSRSRRAAKLAEGLLLLAAGIGGGMVGLFADMNFLGNRKIYWIALVVIMLAAGLHCIRKSRREA